jgi:inner membrane protein
VFSYLLKKKNGDLIVEEVPRDPEEAKSLLKSLGKRVLGN